MGGKRAQGRVTQTFERRWSCTLATCDGSGLVVNSIDGDETNVKVSIIGGVSMIVDVHDMTAFLNAALESIAKAGGSK